jgi:hypothetical protein
VSTIVFVTAFSSLLFVGRAAIFRDHATHRGLATAGEL